MEKIFIPKFHIPTIDKDEYIRGRATIRQRLFTYLLQNTYNRSISFKLFFWKPPHI